jgi:hypothetical protein
VWSAALPDLGLPRISLYDERIAKLDFNDDVGKGTGLFIWKRSQLKTIRREKVSFDKISNIFMRAGHHVHKRGTPPHRNMGNSNFR